jgi:phage/plasmid-like protein (TIGR03299 family)
MHNLNYNDRKGQYSFASAREKAWHGLGQIVEKEMTSREVIMHANLDFEVSRQVLVTESGIQVPTHFANIRTDTNTLLGVVGSKYSILQNRECFEFFDNVVGEGQAVFETAGALGRGEIVFITAKAKHFITVKGDASPVEEYLLLMTSHDSSYPVICLFTPVRVVCNNTLNASLSNCHNKVTIKHTTNARDRFAEAARLMGMQTHYLDRLTEALNHLSAVRVTDATAQGLICRMMLSREELKALAKGTKVEYSTRRENMIREVHHYYMSARDIDPIRGTGYGLYNGITGYFQNYRDFDDKENKMLSIVDGQAFQMQNRMFSMLSAL